MTGRYPSTGRQTLTTPSSIVSHYAYEGCSSGNVSSISPTWFDLENDWQYVGYVLRPITAAINATLDKILTRKNPTPAPAIPDAPPTGTFRDCPTMLAYKVASLGAIGIGTLAIMSWKALS